MNPGVFGFPQRQRRFLTTTAPLTGGGNVSDPPPIGFDASYLRGFLFGLQLANNVGDPTNDTDITSGVCIDSTGTKFIKLAAGVTRQIDVAFGTGNGGLSSSLVAGLTNQTYHWFAVLTATGAASVGIDSSITAANLIADHGVTHFRRILSLRRIAGALQVFVQRDDHVRLTTAVLELNNVAGDTAGVTFALTAIPLGLVLRPDMLIQIATAGVGNAATIITSLTETNTVPTAQFNHAFEQNTSTNSAAHSVASPYVNTSGQLRRRESIASSGTSLHLLGWWDRRGQDS